MTRTILTALVCLTLIPGCARISGLAGSLGGSVGSLGGGGSERPQAAPVANGPLVPPTMVIQQQDSRLTAAGITGAELTPTPGGYLLRATARPPAPGSYNASLVEIGRSNTTLSFAVRMSGAPGARLEPAAVTTAKFIGREDLSGITRIEVGSSSNTIVLRP